MSWEQPTFRYGVPIISFAAPAWACSIRELVTEAGFQYSFEQTQPPTPTRTPTSPSFGDVFQTPKAESSFYGSHNTWNTGGSHNGSPTVSKTPQSSSFGTTVAKQTALSSPTGGQYLGSDFAVNARNILSTPEFSSLQVDQPARSASSPPHTTSQPNETTPSHLNLTLDTTSSFCSARTMQTPPPTTTSASKKQAQQSQTAKIVQQSNSTAARRMSAPLFPRLDNGEPVKSQVEQSPQNYPGLEVSPDIFGYNFATPATAPAYPQHKLFWESDANDGMNIDFPDVPNPFDTPRQPGLDPFISNHPSSSMSQAEVQSSFLNFPDVSTTSSSFVRPELSSKARQVNGTRHNTRQLHTGVDPSLLFSSPGKFSEPLDGSIASARVLDEESLQPYAYQVQEARREKGYNGVMKQKKRRKPSVDSPAVKAALETLRENGDARPLIRRSMTDSVVSRTSKDSADSKVGSTHGRSSPLKRVHDSRGASRKVKHRTSIALTIDENGRARAETRVIQDTGSAVDEYEMEVDSGSESESSSSSTDDSSEAMPTSFAQPAPGPKWGRFNNSTSHSQKSSYASFYSANSHQDGQPRLPEIKQRSVSNALSGNSNRLFGAPHLQPLRESAVMRDDDASEAETIVDPDDEDDNARHELRKVLQDRRKGSSSRPTHHLYSPHKLNTAVFPGNENHPLNSSPTTITDPDLATPTSSHSDSIRCLCHVNRDDGQMIQWRVFLPQLFIA